MFFTLERPVWQSFLLQEPAETSASELVPVEEAEAPVSASVDVRKYPHLGL